MSAMTEVTSIIGSVGRPYHVLHASGSPPPRRPRPCRLLRVEGQARPPGLRHWGTRTGVYAGERREEGPVTDVTIEIGNLSTRTEAIAGPPVSRALGGRFVRGPGCLGRRSGTQTPPRTPGPPEPADPREARRLRLGGLRARGASGQDRGDDDREHLGVGLEPRHGTAYVSSWIKALESDPKEIRAAAVDAQRMSDWLMARERERSMGDHKAGHERPDGDAGVTREQGRRHPSPIAATDVPEQSQAVNHTTLQDPRQPEPAATRPPAGHPHRDTGPSR